MKAPILIFSSLFLSVAVLFSCSEEEDVLTCPDMNTKENNTKNLVRITSDYYKDANRYFSSVTKFVDEKPITIQYSDESYDSMIYQEDMIFEILEFDANKNLEWKTNYDYDYFGRLTMKNVDPGPNNNTNVSRQKTFTYSEGLIESENSWSDGGFHKNTIILNDERQIVEDLQLNSEDLQISRRAFEYIDGNLTEQIITAFEDEVTFEQTFTYLEKTASKAYRYNESLFGDEWKTNSSLNKQFGLGQFDSYEVSENYIAEVNSYFLEDGVSSTNTFTYEFDSDGQLTKQTENISWSTGDNYKVVTTYFYE